MTESGKTQFPKRGLEEENQLLRMEVERLKQILATHGLPAASALINCPTAPPVLLQQPEDRQERGKQRIALFRSLFRGRADVYAKRWTSADGRSGYSPAALMDWTAIHSSNPEDRKKVARQTRTFLPLSDAVVENHLFGKETIGVIPCCLTRPAGFLPSILTRNHGRKMLALTLTIARQWEFQCPWSVHAQEMAATSGFSSISPCQR
jgi:hypothetical protein